MRIATDRENVSEVLAALGGPFQVRFRTSVALDARASRFYSGSFSHVISRLLSGYNYVTRTDRNAIEIFVVGRPMTGGSEGMPARW